MILNQIQKYFISINLGSDSEKSFSHSNSEEKNDEGKENNKKIWKFQN